MFLDFKTDYIFSYDASGYAPPKKYGYQPHKSYGYQPPKTYGYHQSHSDYGYQPHTNYGVKKPEVFGFTYNDGHIDHTINKVTQYANAQDAYKSQQLNVSKRLGGHGCLQGYFREIFWLGNFIKSEIYNFLC